MLSVFFFFKQKTAYEMRISDWSSDVCSSDLRLSDYSNTGTSTTWKAGGTWEPFRGYKLRGIYQHSVRSPNISELFTPITTGLANLAEDPCQGSNPRSEEHTSELQSLMRIAYDDFCLKKTKTNKKDKQNMITDKQN